MGEEIPHDQIWLLGNKYDINQENSSQGQKYADRFKI